MKQLSVTFLILAIILMALHGCASSSEETTSSESETTEILHRYEQTFHPSDYDVVMPDLKSSKDIDENEDGETVANTKNVEKDFAPGFRVQVSFSEDIEQANKFKSELSPLLPNEWVYVVYEAPYYKVRVGDFLTRPEANPTMKSLIEIGYKDAWIVPDKVYKDPPAKPQEVPPEPK